MVSQRLIILLLLSVTVTIALPIETSSSSRDEHIFCNQKLLINSFFRTKCHSYLTVGELRNFTSDDDDINDVNFQILAFMIRCNKTAVVSMLNKAATECKKPTINLPNQQAPAFSPPDLAYSVCPTPPCACTPKSPAHRTCKLWHDIMAKVPHDMCADASMANAVNSGYGECYDFRLCILCNQ